MPDSSVPSAGLPEAGRRHHPSRDPFLAGRGAPRPPGSQGEVKQRDHAPLVRKFHPVKYPGYGSVIRSLAAISSRTSEVTYGLSMNVPIAPAVRSEVS